ncbi:mannose-6-phosphate isomerase [Sphingobium sp. B11D3B]|uniref:AGE family epimerase/isomerase n=1 Tax=Sphingobium sp. B11D3B TaxID=2940575 RepID=UPI002226E34F|nr:AGE family epimerase/isomerase [Sphingobium sp. B11D3B]MCW2387640.1 mannose-6-phosphate isomerase [Sphingobium sp. B11D3B]
MNLEGHGAADLRSGWKKKAAEWLFEHAMPLWLSKGIDTEKGGFFGALDHDDLTNAAPVKRLRVLTRQLYVFCQGAQAGVPGARQAVEHGLQYLIDRYTHPDGGYVMSCDLDGQVADSSRDLYDLAFVLFAFAHVYRLDNDSWVKEKAESLIEFIYGQMTHPSGGYFEGIPPKYPRRQNPHMHLFEAALAGFESFGDSIHRDLSDELAKLFANHFLVRESGIVLEYFEDNLKPFDDTRGRRIVEPGHHLEWAWLLSEHARLLGGSAAASPPIARFALVHGLDQSSGFLRGELFDDGVIATANVRLWPHAEWLKATLTIEQAGDPQWAWNALQKFLDTPTTGLWFERWDAEAGIFPKEPAPATTLYHITSALTTLLSHQGNRERSTPTSESK